MLVRLILLALTAGLCSTSFGQRLGLKGGITHSFVKEGMEQSRGSSVLKSGFQLGVFIDRTIYKNLRLRPALQLTQNGYKTVLGNPDGPFYWNRNLTTTYLEVPMDVIYNFHLTKTSSVFIGSGPVPGYGLQGKLKATIATIDNTQQLHTQSSTNPAIFNNAEERLHFGWDFLLGFQHRRMLLSTSYNHGITNLIKDHLQLLKNRNFAITIGFYIQE